MGLLKGLRRVKSKLLPEAQFTSKGKRMLELIRCSYGNDNGLLYAIARRNPDTAVAVRESIIENEGARLEIWMKFTDIISPDEVVETAPQFSDEVVLVLGHDNEELASRVYEYFSQSDLVKDGRLVAEGYILLRKLKEIRGLAGGDFNLLPVLESIKAILDRQGVKYGLKLAVSYVNEYVMGVIRALNSGEVDNSLAHFGDFKGVLGRTKGEVVAEIADRLCSQGVRPHVAIDAGNRIAFLRREGLTKEECYIFQLRELHEGKDLIDFVRRVADYSERGKKLKDELTRMMDKKGTPTRKEIERHGRAAGLANPVDFGRLLGLTEKDIIFGACKNSRIDGVPKR